MKFKLLNREIIKIGGKFRFTGRLAEPVMYPANVKMQIY